MLEPGAGEGVEGFGGKLQVCERRRAQRAQKVRLLAQAVRPSGRGAPRVRVGRMFLGVRARRESGGCCMEARYGRNGRARYIPARPVRQRGGRGERVGRTLRAGPHGPSGTGAAAAAGEGSVLPSERRAAMAEPDPTKERLATAGPEAGRIVVLAPAGRDPPVACEVLEMSGFRAVAATAIEELCRLLDQGAGAALVSEEALLDGGGPLRTWAARQPPWSDLPVIVLAAPGAAANARSPAVDLLAANAHVTLLDRPVRLVTLASAVTAALRVRRHQYRMRDLLERLADSVRTRDQFLAMLGHELRNPLAAIHTATELLLRAPAEPERPPRSSPGRRASSPGSSTTCSRCRASSPARSRSSAGWWTSGPWWSGPSRRWPPGSRRRG